MSPRVSIITPYYNTTPEFFERSRESIYRQTSGDFEWILVDDGSKEIMLEPDSPAPVHFVRLEANFGPSVARNIGFQVSSGDIITYLDMGDALAPDRVEVLIKTFANYNPELLFSAYTIIDRGQEFVVDHTTLFDKIHPADYLQKIQKTNLSIPLGVAHTRRPFVECGGFQRGIVCGEDGILWRRMVDNIEHTRILFSGDMAGYYYVNYRGQSRTQRRFEMGGFAFDGSRNDNGKYLDEQWFKTYSSKGLYD